MFFGSLFMFRKFTVSIEVYKFSMDFVVSKSVYSYVQTTNFKSQLCTIRTMQTKTNNYIVGADTTTDHWLKCISPVTYVVKKERLHYAIWYILSYLRMYLVSLRNNNLQIYKDKYVRM